VRHFYDVQVIRMQHAGRISHKASGAEVVLSEEDKALMESAVKRLEKIEKEALEVVKEQLAGFPLWTQLLNTDDPRWRGLGPTMAGVLLSEIDIERAGTPSALWKFAGLAPKYAQRCRSCNRLVTREADGWKHERKKANERKCSFEAVLPDGEVYDSGSRDRPEKGVKRGYNLFLKTKLLGVLGSSFMRAGNEVWRKVYDDYKQRWTTGGKGTSPGHVHNAAIRYMIKMFLLDLWKEWRALEGLPVRPSYQEEKQGHVHKRVA
jgi:hypothetical protein